MVKWYGDFSIYLFPTSWWFRVYTCYWRNNLRVRALSNVYPKRHSIYDLVWTDGPLGTVYYRDIFHQNEVEQSTYNFEHADVDALFTQFDQCEKDSQKLIAANLPLPAYEQVMKASHAFNLLDARHAISVTERQRYILRVRTLSKAVAEAFYQKREELGFPMCKNNDASTNESLAKGDK